MRRKRSANGSIILEAAIVIPMFLLMTLLLLSVILTVSAEIYFYRATENVTQEMMVAVPILSEGADALSSMAGNALDGIPLISSEDQGSIQTVVTALGGIAGVTGVDPGEIMYTAVFGRWIRDRIVVEYQEMTADRTWMQHCIKDCSVYLEYDSTKMATILHVYYTLDIGVRETEKEYVSSIPMYTDEWEVSNQDPLSSDANTVWTLPNFARGIAIREAFGGNLPANYPTIARWENGKATAIKSIDITSPYYEDADHLSMTIEGQIDDIVEYDGCSTSWGTDFTIDSSMIRDRELILVVPSNGNEESMQILEEYRNYASLRGVELIIETYGASMRYQTEENPTTAPSESLNFHCHIENLAV